MGGTERDLFRGVCQAGHSRARALSAAGRDAPEEKEPEKKPRLKLELPKLKLKLREDGADKPFSWSEEIRIYKSLLDDGIITEEEFAEKKRQLLGL